MQGTGIKKHPQLLPYGRLGVLCAHLNDHYPRLKLLGSVIGDLLGFFNRFFLSDRLRIQILQVLAG